MLFSDGNHNHFAKHLDARKAFEESIAILRSADGLEELTKAAGIPLK